MRSSGSLDELENASFASNPGALSNMSFATERFERFMSAKSAASIDLAFKSGPQPEGGDDEWEVLTKKIDSQVRMGVEFFEYPKTLMTPELNPVGPSGHAEGTESPSDTKVFLGGMRFELVQMGRHAVQWLLESACKVNVPCSRILIHRRARNGKLSPTGCASVFLPHEVDPQLLLSMNQRVFCGVRGIFVASTAAQMAELIQECSILDVHDGRVRGPTHPIVIERAYRSQTPSSNNSLQGSFAGPPAGGYSPPLNNGSFSRPPPPDPSSAQYHRYDQFSSRVESAMLRQAADVFVGGLCYEATPGFVAWMFSLMEIGVHHENVTLYMDPTTGVKRGCAQVRIEEDDFNRAMSFNRRVLCDAHGVYMSDSAQGIQMLQATRDKSTIRGPTHPVVIERRRNNRRNHPNNNSGGLSPHPGASFSDSGRGGSPPPTYGERQWMTFNSSGSGSPGGVTNASFPNPSMPMMVGGPQAPVPVLGGVAHHIPTPKMFQPTATQQDPPPPSYKGSSSSPTPF